MSDRLIDTHPHIVSTDTARYPISPLGGRRSEWSAKRSVAFEELIVAMDDAGVTKSAIVHSSTTYGFNDDYVADSIAGRLDRFTGVFSVNVNEPDAPEKMRYWHSRGMGGMRIFVRGTTLDGAWMAIDNPITEPAWRCAAELGISVCVNVIARDEGICQLRNVLTKYPSINVLVDHLGNPMLEDGEPYDSAKDFFALAAFPNLFLKYTPSGISAVKGLATAGSFLDRLLGEFGANRICWGSNFPSSVGTLKQIVAQAREELSVYSEDERDWIFFRTAETLYPSLLG